MTDGPILTRFDFLADAGELLRGPRERDYGDAITNITKMAVVMSVMFNTEITPIQAALSMVSLKLSRLSSPSISVEAAVDSIHDAIGYLAIAGELMAVTQSTKANNNVG